jgi:hypothetical protein
MTRYVIAKVHDGVYLPTPRPVTLPDMQPGDSVRVTMRDDGGFDVVPVRPSAAAKEAWGAQMWVDAPQQETHR